VEVEALAEVLEVVVLEAVDLEAGSFKNACQNGLVAVSSDRRNRL
jgi:hypothetical protein